MDKGLRVTGEEHVTYILALVSVHPGYVWRYLKYIRIYFDYLTLFLSDVYSELGVFNLKSY